MKYLLILVLFSTFSFAKKEEKKKTLPIVKEEILASKNKKHLDKIKAITKEKEDCDEKAKKVPEIVPETISLGGNAGCTLE